MTSSQTTKSTQLRQLIAEAVNRVLKRGDEWHRDYAYIGYETRDTYTRANGVLEEFLAGKRPLPRVYLEALAEEAEYLNAAPEPINGVRNWSAYPGVSRASR